MNSNELDSRVCRDLRLPLALMVVFIHSFGLPSVVDAPCFYDWCNVGGVDVYNTLRVAISRVLTHVAVPTFFMISGYYFFFKTEKFTGSVYVAKLKKRFRSLFVPYVTWITLSVLFVMAMKLGGILLHGKPWSGITDLLAENGYLHIYWNSETWNLDRTNVFGMLTPSSSPYLVPMWFIRDLMVVVVCSPVIYWLLTRLKGFGLLLLGFCYLFTISIPLSGFSPTAFFFFGVGAYLSINRKSITDMAQSRFAWIVPLCAIVLYPIMIWFGGHDTHTGNIIYPFFIVSGVGAVVYFTTLIERRAVAEGSNDSLVSRLSHTTFFIFASHAVFGLMITSMIMRRVIPIDVLDSWKEGMAISLTVFQSVLAIVRYIVSPFVTVVVCICIYKVLNKLLPPIMRMLTGGR